jgi:16S rRNA (cytidine1402-2'-O)-methyltransferase
MENSPDRRPSRSPEKRPEAGLLYLVATPIGNLGDLSFRALETLKGVDRIACEDTRTSRQLLDHYGIDKPLVAFHAHNEDKTSERLVERMLQGEHLALVSDAGTPLINDPGYPLVVHARSLGIRIVPIPGPCALIAALSASGLPSSRFAFEGFPPRKSGARKALFETLVKDPRTLVFYESSHRVLETLKDLAEIFPDARRLVIGRELTKRFETICATTVGVAATVVESDADMQKGEFVLVVEGDDPKDKAEGISTEALKVLTVLLRELSVRSASQMAAEITGERRETLYREALRLSSET